MPANRKGGVRERELVTLLDSAGFAVMRAPSSGSATDRELPDVLAGHGGTFYAFEAKAAAGDRVYLDAGEVADLEYFAGRFGAVPRVAVGWDATPGDPHYGRDDRTRWWVLDPAEMYRTDGGNYRATRAGTYGDAADEYGAVPLAAICPDDPTGGE